MSRRLKYDGSLDFINTHALEMFTILELPAAGVRGAPSTLFISMSVAYNEAAPLSFTILSDAF